ncbi:MAG: hypothetical protein ACKOYJ_12060 [Planctomycetia bacterium]
MADTLGLLEECRYLARELGYAVREEPLGELPGGPCMVGGRRQILLNVAQAPTDHLTILLAALASDPDIAMQPKSRLLAERLGQVGR